MRLPTTSSFDDFINYIIKMTTFNETSTFLEDLHGLSDSEESSE